MCQILEWDLGHANWVCGPILDQNNGLHAVLSSWSNCIYHWVKGGRTIETVIFLTFFSSRLAMKFCEWNIKFYQ